MTNFSGSLHTDTQILHWILQSWILQKFNIHIHIKDGLKTAQFVTFLSKEWTQEQILTQVLVCFEKYQLHSCSMCHLSNFGKWIPILIMILPNFGKIHSFIPRIGNFYRKLVNWLKFPFINLPNNGIIILSIGMQIPNTFWSNSGQKVLPNSGNFIQGIW